MNNSIYTNTQLKSIIVPALKCNDIILEAPFEIEPLIEFSEKEEIDIDDVFGKDIIEINFSQTLLACGDPECCGYFTYRYVMIIEKDTIDSLLKK